MSDIYGTSRKRIVGEGWFWIVMVILIVLAIGALVFGIRWVVAKPAGKLQAREQIQSGSNRIAQYDHFFALCASVKTKEATIAALQEEYRTATVARRQQIGAFITANRAGRADTINTYNADASASYTSGQFRSSNLPYQIDPTQEVTICAAP